jgi:hypothetical protein
MNSKTILYDQLSRLQAAVKTRTPPDYAKRAAREQDAAIPPAQHVTENFLEDVLMMRTRGETYAEIAYKLNKHGVRAIKGGRWYNASLSKYMKSKCCEFMCVWPQ